MWPNHLRCADRPGGRAAGRDEVDRIGGLVLLDAVLDEYAMNRRAKTPTPGWIASLVLAMTMVIGVPLVGCDDGSDEAEVRREEVAIHYTLHGRSPSGKFILSSYVNGDGSSPEFMNVVLVVEEMDTGKRKGIDTATSDLLTWDVKWAKESDTIIHDSSDIGVSRWRVTEGPTIEPLHRSSGQPIFSLAPSGATGAGSDEP